MEYVKDPKMIEIKSFEIIQGIIDDIRPGYKFKNEIEEKIIKRCIHTSADFEYLDILKISETAVQTIINALKDYGITSELKSLNKSILSEIEHNLKTRYSTYDVLKVIDRLSDTSSLNRNFFFRIKMKYLG